MSLGCVALEIPVYKLKAILFPDRFQVEYIGGYYEIPIEKQPCNYGGIRYFLHCPTCNRRMRLLYCESGFFSCRKCLKLCYMTQLIRPSWRCVNMANKIKTMLENKAGSLERKPPWMKRRTFKALLARHNEYKETKFLEAWHKEWAKGIPCGW